MKFFIHILLLFSLLQTLLASEAAQLAKELKLQPGAKASIQWRRVFSSARHMKRYGVDKLSSAQRIKLKIYLIEHAADSEQPIVPGL